MNCPNCGAGLKIQNDKAVCEYCGYEELLPGVRNTGNDDFFNMVVFNESPAGETITISVPECNIGFIIRAGEAVAKDIPPGYHTVVVTCDGLTEYRSVLIPNDGRATKVYVSRAIMGISIRVVEPGSDSRFASAGGSRAMNQEMVLPVMALVMSILIPLVGLILAIIDFANCKRQERKLSVLTKVAFILAGLRFVLVFLLIFISAFVR